MHATEQTKRPGRSLGALAALAMRHTNAQGYALYEFDERSNALESLITSGAKSEGAESFPLWNGESFIGLLVFTFSRESITPEKRQILNRSARVIEALLNFFRAGEVHARNAARIGELEADIADEKIADRVGGLPQAGIPADAIELAERHVYKVLDAQHLSRMHEDLLRDLEDRIAERGLVAHAKALLQTRNGLSEQQAYMQLRGSSRRNRKRMGDVARQIIEEEESKSRRHSVS